MLTKILALATVTTISNAVKQRVATFGDGDSGATGTVTVDNGKVTVNIDLTNITEANLPGASLATCADGGFTYHIHEKWDQAATQDYIGSTACGGTYTGGHIDQWSACGAASGSPYCECIPNNIYAPNYPTNFTSAEIGDWSGKYGNIPMEENKLMATEMSFWEVTPDELDEYSVVFHCSSGARAFCARFIESTTDATATIPAQSSSGKTVGASFSALSDESMIVLYPNGNVTAYIDASDAYTSVDVDGCAEFEWGIYESTSVTLSDNALGSTCDDKVGAQYDPTNQCLPWTASPFCIDGKICGDPTYEYNCDFSTDRYSCAPGDLSGKFGILTNPEATALNVESDNKESLIPTTDDLIGKIIAITCPKNSGDTAPTIFACGVIKEGVPSPSTSGVGCVKVVMAVVMSFVAFLY